MKNPLVLFLVFKVFLFSCTESEDLVPILNQPWLKDQIEMVEQSDLSPYFYLVQAKYQGKTVYYFGNCCPFCLSAPADVYDESGKLIVNLSSLNSDDLENNEIIWQGENHQCQN